MKRVRLLCVGKASKPFCRDGCAEYLKRLKGFYDTTVIEIPEQPSVRREGEELLKRIGGELVTSEGLAELVRSAHERADEVTFIIGGASGTDDAVRAKCARRISFGRVTYPHQIARLLLCEQLYRAATILRGLPYHK